MDSNAEVVYTNFCVPQFSRDGDLLLHNVNVARKDANNKRFGRLPALPIGNWKLEIGNSATRGAVYGTA